MTLLSWNIRGLGNANKIPKFTSLILNKHFDFVGLCEIKLMSCDQVFVNKIWDNPDVNFLACNFVTSNSGGILAMWNGKSFCFKKYH